MGSFVWMLFLFHRYEQQEFQSRVRTNYDDLMDETWKIVDTDGKDMEQVRITC